MTTSPPPLPPPSSDHPGVVVLGDPGESAIGAAPVHSRLAAAKRVAVVLLAVAAVALAVGTFQPYEVFSLNSDSQSESMNTTAWAVTITHSGDFATPGGSHPPYYGVLFCLIAIALLVGMGLLVRASAATKTFTIAAATAAVTATAMIATDVASFLSYYAERTPDTDKISTSIGSGLWVFLAGSVLAVAGVVIAALPSRTPLDDDGGISDSTADLDTPPMGFPAPAIHE